MPDAKPITAHLWYSDDWQTVTLYEEQELDIRHGLRAEAGSPVPGTCSARLTEDWNPIDPTSTAYGLASRYTELRIGYEPGLTSGPLADGTDAFMRTEATGWGTADVGGDWSLLGAGGSVITGDWSVTTGTAWHDLTTSNAYRVSYLGDLSIEDCTQQVSWSIPLPTGNDLEPANLIFRYGTVNEVTSRVTVSTTGEISLYAFSNEGDLIGYGQVADVVTTSADTFVHKARVWGDRVAAKVWAGAPEDEPDGWDLLIEDYTMVTAITGGPVAIRSGRAAGNTNSSGPQFALSDYQVIVNSPRMSAEIASWKPAKRIASTGWVDIELGGIMRRFGKRDTPLRSPLYRFFSRRTDTIGYHPVEDGSSATWVGSGLWDGTKAIASGVTFGESADDLAGTASVATLPAGAWMSASMPNKGSDEWTLSFLVKLPEAPASDTLLATIQAAGDSQYWYVYATSVGWHFYVRDPDGSLLDEYNVTYGTGAEPPVWIVMSWRVEQSGSSVLWQPTWHVVGTGIYWTTTEQSFTGTVGRPSWWKIEASGDLAGTQICHVYMADLTGPSLYDIAQVAAGYRYELGEDRGARLAEELGTKFVLDGTEGDTGMMAPQRIEPANVIMGDIAEVDQGVLYEPRHFVGFALRTLRSMYSQDATLALDMTAGGIGEPIDVALDDLPIYNDVTVSRPRGSSARRILEDGPAGTADPPDGAGVAPYSKEIQVASDGQLADQAQWRLNQGTVDEPRYPVVTVDLDARPDLLATMLMLRVGDVITIDELDNQGTLRAIVLGWTEQLSNNRHLFDLVLAPATAYDVWVLEDSVLGLLDSDGSTVASAFVAGTDTSLSVAVATAHPLWVTGSVDFEIITDGCILTVSSISGSSSPQTFTVSSTVVNGIAKTISAGKSVHLRRPVRVGK